jgi:hypothetical protein
MPMMDLMLQRQENAVVCKILMWYCGLVSGCGVSVSCSVAPAYFPAFLLAEVYHGKVDMEESSEISEVFCREGLTSTTDRAMEKKSAS